MTHSSDGRPRARGLGIALPGEPGPLNAITDVGGVEVGVTTLIGGDVGAHRRHRDSAARPRTGRPAVRRGLVLAQRQRRDDRHHLDRRGRIVQSACRAVEYARGRRLPHRRRQLGQPGQSTARPAVAAARLRGDLGRLPQRHQRRPRPARTCRGGARRGDRGSGGRGIGRRRDRDELLRIQGRQRYRVAGGSATGDGPSRLERSCRRTSAPASN